MPHPLPNPAWPQQCSWPAISEICPPGEGMILRLTRSSGRPNRLPDHSLGTDADQRQYLSLVSVVARCRALLRRLGRPTDGPNADLVHGLVLCAEGGEGVLNVRLPPGGPPHRSVNPSADAFHGSNS
jgi:hypothetical protein